MKNGKRVLQRRTIKAFFLSLKLSFRSSTQGANHALRGLVPLMNHFLLFLLSTDCLLFCFFREREREARSRLVLHCTLPVSVTTHHLSRGYFFVCVLSNPVTWHLPWPFKRRLRHQRAVARDYCLCRWRRLREAGSDVTRIQSLIHAAWIGNDARTPKHWRWVHSEAWSL